MVKNLKKFQENELIGRHKKIRDNEKSLKYRADLINDVSGFSYDKDSMNFIKKNNAAKVLHHMLGTP